MQLYLVQHGEALSKDVDPGRPLSAKGAQDVARITKQLNQAGVTLNRVLHSGKMRARQTAEILADKLLLKGDAEQAGGINPNDAVAVFSMKVHQLKNDTMVIGHLPFMARLVAYLTTGDEELDIVAYRPGSVVCLEKDPEQKWRIIWMLRPDFIKSASE